MKLDKMTKIEAEKHAYEQHKSTIGYFDTADSDF